MNQTEVEMTAQQIADQWGISARQVNNYRAACESATGKKLGRKRGKQTFFSAAEIGLIGQARFHATETHTPPSDDIDEPEPAAPGTITGDMAAIVEAGDHAAITMGQQIGARWNTLLMQAAIGEMTKGVSQFASQMQEANEFAQARASISLKAAQLPQAKPLNFLESDNETDPDLG